MTSTIELAAKLGLVSIAEGVESEAVFTRLEQLGCDMAQGYWIKAPVAESEITSWLSDSRWGVVPLDVPGVAS